MRRFFIFSLFLIFNSVSLSLAQNTQTIRGVVTDGEIKTGLPYANIRILNLSNLGTTTDDDGRFVLNNIPVGRHFIIISYIGYKAVTIPILLKSGKSSYIAVELVPDIGTLKGVLIKSNKFDKFKFINEFATTSARVFSVEETERYAGSLGDPARMAQNFAGVSSAGDSRNDIVIRGNAPFGLLWRIDGVDVANPNHFGAKGSTGGAITILNNNLLTNSDFLTGAFPAQYGNAFSGVFDLKMRRGNAMQFEKTFQIGWNGVEIGLEGPLTKNKSSFVFAYRYADLRLLKKLDIDFGVNGVPKYQDITTKADFKTKRAGDFSFVLIGGRSKIKINRGKIGQSAYEALWDITTKNDKLIALVNHQIKLTNRSSLKSFISFSVDKSEVVLDSTQTKNSKFLFARLNETDYSLATGFTYRKRISKKNVLSAGLRIYKQGIKYIDSTFSKIVDKSPVYYVFTDTKKHNLWQMQTFVQWKHHFSNRLYSSLGINYNYLIFNDTYSWEPRIGLNYVVKKHHFGAGYGLVGKPLPLITYFTRDKKTNNLNNYKLKFYKSHQFSIADNWILSSNFRIKLEVYYQSLFNIAVEREKSYFSLVNFGSEFFQERPESLTSKGKGENYGVELTLEKFLSKGWYFLTTFSVFKSRYLASDNIWRNSQFDSRYIANILGGYEFNLKRNFIFQINDKLTLAGGRPLESHLPDGSIDEKSVFTRRSKPYFRNDLRLSLIKNYRNKTHELSVDFQNITDHKNEYLRNFNDKTKREEISYQMGFLPVINYRLTF